MLRLIWLAVLLASPALAGGTHIEDFNGDKWLWIDDDTSEKIYQWLIELKGTTFERHTGGGSWKGLKLETAKNRRTQWKCTRMIDPSAPGEVSRRPSCFTYLH